MYRTLIALILLVISFSLGLALKNIGFVILSFMFLGLILQESNGSISLSAETALIVSTAAIMITVFIIVMTLSGCNVGKQERDLFYEEE